MRILITGAGLSGATIARQLADAGDHQIHIIEQRDHIAGNCYDYVNDAGILMNKYGAHLFHTSSERVWAFVQRFAEWTPWKHRVIGRIGETYFPIPANIDTVNTLCGTDIKTEEEMRAWLASAAVAPPGGVAANSEEVALARVGPVLYEKIFKDYTYKQWAKWPAELAPSVLERIPVRSDWDPHYFSDRWQALPARGYTEMVRSMLDHPAIRVSLSTAYEPEMRADYDCVFYTGPIDQYYAAAGYPRLEYRSIRFEEETLAVDQYQPNSVVNYPSMAEPFTRIVEYKHFLNQVAPGRTTIVREYTTSDGDPYYPVPTAANQATYAQYQVLAAQERDVYFVGRLANYKYYNMDAAILAALEAVDKFLSRIFETCSP
jgi:UDP-galactopyranose mutase